MTSWCDYRYSSIRSNTSRFGGEHDEWEYPLRKSFGVASMPRSMPMLLKGPRPKLDGHSRSLADTPTPPVEPALRRNMMRRWSTATTDERLHRHIGLLCAAGEE